MQEFAEFAAKLDAHGVLLQVFNFFAISFQHSQRISKNDSQKRKKNTRIYHTASRQGVYHHLAGQVRSTFC